MAFMANGLRDAFEGQGDAQFFAFSYACFDPLEEVLEPGYFPSGRLLKVGDLMFVGTRPRPAESSAMTPAYFVGTAVNSCSPTSVGSARIALPSSSSGGLSLLSIACWDALRPVAVRPAFGG